MAKQNRDAELEADPVLDPVPGSDGGAEAGPAEVEPEASAAPGAEAELATAPEIDEREALNAEVAELKDRLLRALAEAENVRKRAERDRRDAELYGLTRFARDLLAVHDNFERALSLVTDEVRATAPGLIEGIELTQRDLVTALAKHKIATVAPEIGERFDPKLHQAMFEAPVPATRAGDIIQVMGVGFTIGERLLRPAQVGVSAGGPAAAGDLAAAGDPMGAGDPASAGRPAGVDAPGPDGERKPSE